MRWKNKSDSIETYSCETYICSALFIFCEQYNPIKCTLTCNKMYL